MNNNDLDNAEIWLRQVVKGELADKETIKAIDVVLAELEKRNTNSNLIYDEGYKDGYEQAEFEFRMNGCI